MTAPPRYAYAQARMRALKATLWDVPAVTVLRAQAAQGRSVPHDRDVAWARLVRWYVTLIRAYPDPAGVLRAMLRIHHTENLKLLWRCTVRGRSVAPGAWRPLGALAPFPPEPAASLPLLVEHLPRGEYRTIAAETYRSHGDDLFAADLAFDAWAAGALHEAAGALTDREQQAREILYARLRIRDLDLVSRGIRSFHLEPAFVARLTVRLSHECSQASLARLAAWDEQGPPPEVRGVVRRLAAGARSWADIRDRAVGAWLRECRRAFLGSPYRLAPAVAALAIAEWQIDLESRLDAAAATGRPVPSRLLSDLSVLVA